MKARINLSITFDILNNDLTVKQIRESLNGKLEESSIYVYNYLLTNKDTLTVNKIELKPSKVELCHTIGGTSAVWDDNDHSHFANCWCQECKDNNKGHWNPDHYWNKSEYIERSKIEYQLYIEEQEKRNRKWYQIFGNKKIKL